MKFIFAFLLFVTSLVASEKAYDAKIISVTDGDTATAVVELGLSVSKIEKIRILGIDAPEMNTEAGKKSKAILEKKILNKTVILVTHGDIREKYGRLLADIILKDLSISKYMIEVGAAKPYSGGKRE